MRIKRTTLKTDARFRRESEIYHSIGQDLVFTAPEPGSLALLGAGVVTLGLRLAKRVRAD